VRGGLAAEEDVDQHTPPRGQLARVEGFRLAVVGNYFAQFVSVIEVHASTPAIIMAPSAARFNT
jgi:hypothetical protein